MKKLCFLLVLAAVMSFLSSNYAFCGDKDTHGGDNKDDANSGKPDEIGDGDSGQGNDKFSEMKKRMDELKKKFNEDLYTADRFDEADADDDGYVSAEEAEDAAFDFERGKDGKNRFNMADKDGDGRLTLDEAKEQKFWEKNKADEWKDKHKTGRGHGDKDYDDDASSEAVDELLNSGGQLSPDTDSASSGQKSFKQRFDENGDGSLDEIEIEKLKEFARAEILAKLDKNSDGTIDDNEKEIIRQWRQNKRAKEVVDEFDEDNDGKLNEAEKNTAKDALSKKFDLNGDGQIDEKERALFRQFKEGKSMPPSESGGEDVGIAPAENPSDWKANGPRGKFMKKFMSEHPELKAELDRILKEHPEWQDDLVDKGERARWILEHADAFPNAAKAIFEWLDNDPNNPDREWVHQFASKRLAIWANEHPEAAKELREFVKEHPEYQKNMLGQEGVAAIMENGEKYPALCGFVAKYAKRHPDAPIAKTAAPFIKNKIMEDNKDFVKETKNELKSSKNYDEFNENLANRTAKIREKLKAEGLSDEDIDNAVKDFEKKAKQEFKEHFERKKAVWEKVKKEAEKMDDEYAHQMKKDREEFRKQLIREYDDGEEIAAALREYDEKAREKQEAFRAELKEKFENPDNWNKDEKQKSDGKLSKEDKENIKGKIEKHGSTTKKMAVTANNPDSEGDDKKPVEKEKTDKDKQNDKNAKEKEYKEKAKEVKNDKSEGKPSSGAGEKSKPSGEGKK